MISVRIRATTIISASNCELQCIGLLSVFSVFNRKNDFNDYMQEWYIASVTQSYIGWNARNRKLSPSVVFHWMEAKEAIPKLF